MIRLITLGSIELRNGDQTELRSVLAQPKRTALLAFLALARPSGFHRRDTLLALLWPELPDVRARAALNKAIHHIRRALGEHILVGRGVDDVGLDPNRFASDVAEFEAALSGDPERALGLYQGDLLEGFHLSDTPDFERWLDGRRAELRGLATQAAWASSDAAAARGDGRHSIILARRALTLTPDDEPGLRRLLQLYQRAGDRAGAVAAYESFAQRMREEWSTQPSDATHALLQVIRSASLYLPQADTTSEVANGAIEAQATLPIPQGVPAAASADAPRRGRRARWLAAIVAAGLALAGSVAGWRLLDTRHSVGTATGTRTSVIVFPFAVDGDTSNAFLGTAMVELLTNAVDGFGGLRGIDPRTVLAAVNQASELGGPRQTARLAERLDAERFVMGRIVARGGTLRIAAALYDRRQPGLPIAQATADGVTQDPFTAVDRLAAELLAAGEPEARRDLSKAAALTSNLPALKAFLEAEQALRGSSFLRAVAEYTRAIELDTTFALAFLRLARLATWNGMDVRADTLLPKAQRFEHKLTPRYRLALRAAQARAAADPATEMLLQDYVRQYPDDVDGWFELGDWLLHENPVRGQPLADAEKALDRAARIDSTYDPALGHLFEIKVLGGKHTEAARALRLSGDQARTMFWQILNGLEDRRPAAFEDAVRMLTETPSVRARTIARNELVSLTDLTGDAERIFRALLAQEQDRGTRLGLRRVLTWIELKQGNAQDAWAEVAALEGESGDETYVRVLMAALPWMPVNRTEFERARSLYESRDLRTDYRQLDERRLQVPERARQFLLAVISRRLGDQRAVTKYLERLSDPAGDSVAVALGRELAAALRARLAADAGDLMAARSALATFTISRPRSGAVDATYIERNLVAETAQLVGDHATALRWYRSLHEDYTTVRTVVFRAAALLGEGRALDKLGQRDLSRARFQRVRRLWSDADPDLQTAAWALPR